MAWTDVVNAVNGSVSAAALLVGGSFAYVKFVRGRDHHGGLEIDVQAELVSVDHRPTIKVAVAAENCGTLRLGFDGKDCRQEIVVTLLDKYVWENAISDSLVIWSAGVEHFKHDLLAPEDAKHVSPLEPGTTLRRHLLIPLPTTGWYACQVSVTVTARCLWWWTEDKKPSTWQSECILTEV